jgi:hypothetical protein
MAVIFREGAPRQLICLSFASFNSGADSWTATSLSQRVKVMKMLYFVEKGENKMLGLGLLGTIIVILVIVWLVRRV